MTSKITRDVLEAHLGCKFKAHLKLAEQQGEHSEYEVMLTERREEVRLGSLDKILCQESMDRIERGISLNSETMKRGPQFILDAVLDDATFLLGFDGLKKVSGRSKLV